MKKFTSTLLVLTLMLVIASGLSFAYEGNAEKEEHTDYSSLDVVYLEYEKEQESEYLLSIEIEDIHSSFKYTDFELEYQYHESEEDQDSFANESGEVSTLYASKTLIEVNDPIHLFWIPLCDTALYLVIWDETEEPIGGTLQSAGTNSVNMSIVSEGVFSYTIYSFNIDDGTATRGNTVTITVTPNTLAEPSTLSANKSTFMVGDEGTFSWTSVPGADTYTLVLLTNPFNENAGASFVQQAYQTTSTQTEYMFNEPGIFTFMIIANHSSGKSIEGNLITVIVS